MKILFCNESQQPASRTEKQLLLGNAERDFDDKAPLVPTTAYERYTRLVGLETILIELTGDRGPMKASREIGCTYGGEKVKITRHDDRYQ